MCCVGWGHPVHANQFRAKVAKRLDHAQPESAGATRDDRYLALKVHLASPSELDVICCDLTSATRCARDRAAQSSTCPEARGHSQQPADVYACQATPSPPLGDHPLLSDVPPHHRLPSVTGPVRSRYIG